MVNLHSTYVTHRRAENFYVHFLNNTFGRNWTGSVFCWEAQAPQTWSSKSKEFLLIASSELCPCVCREMDTRYLQEHAMCLMNVNVTHIPLQHKTRPLCNIVDIMALTQKKTVCYDVTIYSSRHVPTFQRICNIHHLSKSVIIICSDTADVSIHNDETTWQHIPKDSNLPWQPWGFPRFLSVLQWMPQ